MKIKLVDSGNASRKQIYAFGIGIVVLLLALSILVDNFHQSAPALDNKYNPSIDNQCWQSSSYSDRAYCNPINVGNNQWVDIRSNPLEKFLN
jgi:hypothetical protein